jgi:hypothetical protein
MTVVLPQQTVAPAASWAFHDFLNLQPVTQPAAGGRAEFGLPQLGPDDLWLLEHMVAYCDSTTPTRLRLYNGAADPLRLLDGTAKGNFDVADWTGLQLPPFGALVAVWSGASDGARGVLTIQGRHWRRA